MGFPICSLPNRRLTSSSALTVVCWSLFLLACSILGAAQENDVHITPRIAGNTSISGSTPGMDPSLKTHTKPLRSDVDLILVPVTVTDAMDRLVTGLEKENFEVYEGKEKQPIRNLSSEDAPVSVGVLMDMSGSMANKFDKAKEAVVQFMQTANPEDEF